MPPPDPTPGLTRDTTPNLTPEPTLNRTGLIFPHLAPTLSPFLSSLPDSPLPVLDLGAAYGAHTLAAIRASRPVIAVDSHTPHLDQLRHRFHAMRSSPTATSPPHADLLRATITATLPASPDLFPPASIAGAHMSELLHYLPPRGVPDLFAHVSQWLAPGALFVVSAVAHTQVDTCLQRAYVPLNPSHEHAEFVHFRTPESHPFYQLLPPTICLWSVQGIRDVARKAGFKEVEARYCASGKYPSYSGGDETLLMVAANPG